MTYVASYHGFTVDGQTPTTGDEIYVEPGQSRTVKFKFRNDGTSTWSKTGANPVRLGTSNPDNRASGFADNGSGGLNTGWLNAGGYTKNRIEMAESSVTPGNYAHFEAVFRGTPEAFAAYGEKFKLVAESLQWINPQVTCVCDMRPIFTVYFPWYLANSPTEGFRWGTGLNVPSNRTTDIPKIGNGTTVDDGFYSVLNPEVAYRQVELMQECGFNLIMMVWRGHNTVENYGVELIRDAIINNPEFSNMRYCLHISIPAATPAYPFDYIYDALTDDGFYAKKSGKPLLPTWGTAAQSDNRFTMPSMCAFAGQTSWIFETAWPVYGESPVKGDAGVCTPRYDDRKLGEMPYGRSPVQHYNKDLAGTQYQDQFNAVKTAWNNRTINAAGFTTWNEHHERTAIEPHEDVSVEGPTVDRNANVDTDTYLFDITKGYIDQLKA